MPLTLRLVGQHFTARVKPRRRFAVLIVEVNPLNLVKRGQLRSHQDAGRLDAFARYCGNDRDVGTLRRHLLDCGATIGVRSIDLVPDFDLRDGRRRIALPVIFWPIDP